MKDGNHFPSAMRDGMKDGNYLPSATGDGMQDGNYFPNWLEERRKKAIACLFSDRVAEKKATACLFPSVSDVRRNGFADLGQLRLLKSAKSFLLTEGVG